MNFEKGNSLNNCVCVCVCVCIYKQSIYNIANIEANVLWIYHKLMDSEKAWYWTVEN